MGRPIRIEYAGGLYHITSRGNERKAIFRDGEDKAKFLEILRDYHERYGIMVHAYVLMGNHYHLILETPQGNLLKVMHGLNGRYTGYFNRKYGRVGHLFQGRYKGIIVEKGAYLIPLSRYVHLNPVRAGMAERPEQYRWSSYPRYIGRGKEHGWMECSWILSQFGKSRIRARKKYREYTEEGIRGKVESPLRVHGQVILGEEKFIEKIKRMVSGRRLSREIIERGTFVERPNLEQVLEIVMRSFGVKEGDIRDKGGRANTARKAALYFSQRYTGLGNDVVGRFFGGIHYSGVSKASARLKEEMLSNKKLRKLMEEIDSHFKT